jgi:N-acetylneuraminic acid mutarotase
VVEIYEPSRDTWKTAAPMPTARGFHGAAVLDGRIYVLGGRGAEPHPTEVYDPASDSWKSLPNADLDRARFGTGVPIGNRIYVLAGEKHGGGLVTSELVRVFSAETGAWR